MRVLAFVPAKGTSERLPGKNSLLLDGEPLFIRALRKLESIDIIDEVWLDTECPVMADLAKKHGYQVSMRDKALADNNTDGSKLMLDAIERHPHGDVYVQHLCTAPHLEEGTIESCIKTVVDGPCQSACTFIGDALYKWSDGKPSYDVKSIPNSKHMTCDIWETMGLYAIRKKEALKTQSRTGLSPAMTWTSQIEAVDINGYSSYEFAQVVAAGLKEEDNWRLRGLAPVLSTSMIADILGPSCALRGLMGPSGMTVVGRARPMQLMACEPEDAEGIYDCLDSYNYVGSGDVLVVSNPGSRAYFGELNARLAMRAGAHAAVIDGMSRDSEPVDRLGFPTWCRGYTPVDVKGYSTLGDIGLPVYVGGCLVKNGDLVVADGDGVVVIPQDKEQYVIDGCLKTLEKEQNIVTSIASGMDVSCLLPNHGEF